MVKCEEDGDGETDFHNENTLDDGIGGGGGGGGGDSSSSGDDKTDNSKDSDFHPSDYESKRTRDHKRALARKAARLLEDQTTGGKRKYKKKGVKTEASDETQLDVKTEDVDPADPNASKKKRNYKKRATKEKETFECDICHYKVNHRCMCVFSGILRILRCPKGTLKFIFCF